MLTRAKCGIFKPKIYNILYEDELENLKQALEHRDWLKAMKEEINTPKNKTWTLTTLPKDKNIIG